jgi:O-antigen/teichoic acid export membrane protein
MHLRASPGDPGTSRTLTAWTAAVTATGQVVSRASTLLLTALATAVVTRTIGEAGFADWGTVLMLFAMVAFVLDPGLAPVVVRRLIQQGDEAPSPASLLAVRLAMAVVAYAGVVGLTVLLRGHQALVLALVLGAQLLPRAVVLNVGTWMQAEHRLHIQTMLETVTAAGGLVLLVAAAALGASAPVLAGAGLLAPAIVLAVLMQRELRRLPHASARDPGEERRLIRAVLREAAPLAGAIVLVSLYTRIGIIFVNQADDGRVAEFVLAFLFVEQALVVAAIVAATLLPMLGDRVSPHRAGPVEQDLLVGVTTLGAFGALLLIALAEPLVLLLGGSELKGAAPVLTLLAPACAAIFGNVFVAYLFVAARRSPLYLAYSLVGLAISVALGFALTLQHGAEGAARATWITELVVVTLAAVPYFGRSGPGRQAVLTMVAAVAMAVAASELAADGAVAPVPAALLAGALLAAVTASRMHRLVGHVRLARAPSGQR